MAAPLPGDTPPHQGTATASSRPLRSLPGGPQSDSIMTGSTLDLVALLRASEHQHLQGGDCGGGGTTKGGATAAAAASAAATTTAVPTAGSTAGPAGHHSPVAAGGGSEQPRPARPPPAAPAKSVSGAKGLKSSLPADAEDDERLFSYLIQAPPTSKAALSPNHSHHHHRRHPSIGGIDADTGGGGGGDDRSDVPTMSASVTESIGDPLGPDSPCLDDAGPGGVTVGGSGSLASPSHRGGVLSMAVAAARQGSSLLRPPQPCGASSMGGITRAVAICVPFAMDDDWRSEESEPSSPSPPATADGGDMKGGGEEADAVEEAQADRLVGDMDTSAMGDCRRDDVDGCRGADGDLMAPQQAATPAVGPQSMGPSSMSATSSSDMSSERSPAPVGLSPPTEALPLSRLPLPPLPTEVTAAHGAAPPVAEATVAAAQPLPPSPVPPATPAAVAPAPAPSPSDAPTSPTSLPPLAPSSAAGLLLRGVVGVAAPLADPSATPGTPPTAVVAAAKAPTTTAAGPFNADGRLAGGRAHGDTPAPDAPSSRPCGGGRPPAPPPTTGTGSSVVVAPAGAAVATAPRAAAAAAAAVGEPLARRSLSRSTSSSTVDRDAAAAAAVAAGEPPEGGAAGGGGQDVSCMTTDVCLSPMPSLCLSPPLGLSLSPSPDVSLSSLVPILCLAAPRGGAKTEHVAAASTNVPAVGGASAAAGGAGKTITRPLAAAVAPATAVVTDPNIRRTSPVGGICIPPAPDVRRLALAAERSVGGGCAHSSGPSSSTSPATASVESRPFPPVATSPLDRQTVVTVFLGLQGHVAQAVASQLPASVFDPRYAAVYAAHAASAAGQRPAYHPPPPGAYALGAMAGAAYGVPPGTPYWLPHPGGGALVYPGAHAPPGAVAYAGPTPPAAEVARNARSDRDKVYVRCVCGQDNHIRRLACSRCARRKEAKPVIKKQSRAVARKERAAAAAAAAAAGPPRASTILPRSFTPRAAVPAGRGGGGAAGGSGVHSLAPGPPPGGVVVPGATPGAGGWWPPPGAHHAAYPLLRGGAPPPPAPGAPAGPPPRRPASGGGGGSSHPHPGLGAPASAEHPPPHLQHAHRHHPHPSHVHHPEVAVGGGAPLGVWAGHAAYPHPSALADISAAVVASVAASAGGNSPAAVAAPAVGGAGGSLAPGAAGAAH
ncbi:hypothetical protein MMPV_009688 [Pyropia vietnamensis]